SCGCPRCSPKGRPDVRLITHAPIANTLTSIVTRSNARDGDTSSITAITTWAHPVSANPMPSTAELLQCDGTMPRWMTPAAPESTASSTCPTLLSSKEWRLLVAAMTNPLRTSPPGLDRQRDDTPSYARSAAAATSSTCSARHVAGEGDAVHTTGVAV